MAKTAEAFRTISEVADDLGIQKHVLRFWEVKFNQIRPMKRGGGRRYYRPEDMELLRGIRQLLHQDGYTIKGVQKILREQGVEAVKQRVLEEAAAAAAKAASTHSEGAPVAAESDVPQRRQKGRPKAARSLVDRQKVLLAAIAELTKCRDLLKGSTAGTAATGTAATGAGGSAVARGGRSGGTTVGRARRTA